MYATTGNIGVVTGGGSCEHDEPVIIIQQPGPLDCLFGRGKSHYLHPGNKRMLDIVKSYKTKYLKSFSAKEKKKIVDTVIEEIKNPSLMIKSASEDSGSGIRFLMKVDGDKDKWQIAPTKEIYIKVRNALRDKKQRKNQKKKRPRSSSGSENEEVDDDDDDSSSYFSAHTSSSRSSSSTKGSNGSTKAGQEDPPNKPSSGSSTAPGLYKPSVQLQDLAAANMCRGMMTMMRIDETSIPSATSAGWSQRQQFQQYPAIATANIGGSIFNKINHYQTNISNTGINISKFDFASEPPLLLDDGADSNTTDQLIPQAYLNLDSQDLRVQQASSQQKVVSLQDNGVVTNSNAAVSDVSLTNHQFVKFDDNNIIEPIPMSSLEDTGSGSVTNFDSGRNMNLFPLLVSESATSPSGARLPSSVSLPATGTARLTCDDDEILFAV